MTIISYTHTLWSVMLKFVCVCFRTSRMACTNVHSNFSTMRSGFFTTVSFTMEVSKILSVWLSTCLSLSVCVYFSTCLSVFVAASLLVMVLHPLSTLFFLTIDSILVESTLTDTAKAMLRICKREVKNCNHVCAEYAMMMSIDVSGV